MNKWNIPNWMENEIKGRDKACVYCGIKFTSYKKNRKTSASWEHIVNDARIITLKNICLCCISCNASKGSKDIKIWIDSSYCKNKKITFNTVAQVVKDAILNPIVYKNL